MQAITVTRGTVCINGPADEPCLFSSDARCFNPYLHKERPYRGTVWASTSRPCWTPAQCLQGTPAHRPAMWCPAAQGGDDDKPLKSVTGQYIGATQIAVPARSTLSMCQTHCLWDHTVTSTMPQRSFRPSPVLQSDKYRNCQQLTLGKERQQVSTNTARRKSWRA